MRMTRLFRTPLPLLSKGKALLIRLLMLPNIALAEVEGEEHLRDASGSPCIFVLNHNNAFESLFVPVLIIFLLGGQNVSFVIDWMYGHLPIVGWFMRQTDPVFVHNKPSRLAFLERRRIRVRQDVVKKCLLRLCQGGSIGIFPEGTMNHDPKVMLRAKPGVGHLALRSSAPVIPVGIRFPASGRLGRPPYAGRMTVTFGQPLRFGQLSAAYRKNIDEGCRTEAARLAAVAAGEVMLAVSVLCGKEYPHLEQKLNKEASTNHTPEATCPA
ncbi:MAG: 1-acyl-sn-glycerol-3-phosphate acyltransferase [Chlorobiaceae bacterium]|nr:1-acyl-sn-glycerol-3-phosphate acyltransferase [Chlorobiaceae bacterium]